MLSSRKERPSRKSLEEQNGSKEDDGYFLDSSEDNQSADPNCSENWKLFESEDLSEVPECIKGVSALPSRNDDEDRSLFDDEVSFPSEKGNTLQLGTIVSPEGE